MSPRDLANVNVLMCITHVLQFHRRIFAILIDTLTTGLTKLEEPMFTILPEDDAILHLRKPFSFLSNFSRSVVYVDGQSCATVEHAYHMQKTLDPGWREIIRLKKNPQWAKQTASMRSFPQREDWDTMKVEVMRNLLVQKFSRHPKLAAKLLATGDRVIAEANHWGDVRWGVCQDADGVWRGENLLGVLLMEVRAKLRSGELQVCEESAERLT